MEKKIKIELTKSEIMLLIAASNWASKAYFEKNMPHNCIKISEINEKLNRAIRENLI